LKKKFGYNDTEHFSKEKKNRAYYFKKVKEVWTASRKRSKIKRETKNMLLTLKKEASCYPFPASIILRAQKRNN